MTSGLERARQKMADAGATDAAISSRAWSSAASRAIVAATSEWLSIRSRIGREVGRQSLCSSRTPWARAYRARAAVSAR